MDPALQAGTLHEMHEGVDGAANDERFEPVKCFAQGAKQSAAEQEFFQYRDDNSRQTRAEKPLRQTAKIIRQHAGAGCQRGERHDCQRDKAERETNAEFFPVTRWIHQTEVFERPVSETASQRPNPDQGRHQQ